MKLIYVYIKYFDFFVWDWGGGWLYKVFEIWLRRLFLLCEGSFANIMVSSYVLWLFWKCSSFIFWILTEWYSYHAYSLIFHLIVFRFSHQILQWARGFLVLTYLPKMYMYCIDTHLTYIYIVNHLIISYVCDIMLSLCVVRVSQLFWNCILIYFFTLTLSVMKVWLHVLWFLASMRKMILLSRSWSQYSTVPY